MKDNVIEVGENMTNDTRLQYNKLLGKTKDLIILQSAESIIQWDMETIMHPRAVE